MNGCRASRRRRLHGSLMSEDWKIRAALGVMVLVLRIVVHGVRGRERRVRVRDDQRRAVPARVGAAARDLTGTARQHPPVPRGRPPLAGGYGVGLMAILMAFGVDRDIADAGLARDGTGVARDRGRGRVRGPRPADARGDAQPGDRLLGLRGRLGRAHGAARRRAVRRGRRAPAGGDLVLDLRRHHPPDGAERRPAGGGDGGADRGAHVRDPDAGDRLRGRGTDPPDAGRGRDHQRRHHRGRRRSATG